MIISPPPPPVRSRVMGQMNIVPYYHLGWSLITLHNTNIVAGYFVINTTGDINNLLAFLKLQNQER